MEAVYEFDSLSELPPLPQEFDPMEYSINFSSAITSLEPLAPFPSSDFTPSGFTFSDHQQYGADSSFLDSPLSLLTRRHYLADTMSQLEELFHDDIATPFLHLPHLKSLEPITTDAAVENTKPFLSLSSCPKALVKSTFTISPSSSSNSRSPAAPSSSSKSKSTYGGDRRRKISDKIRSLEKLMPWEKKMSLATILEEAHKYIKFLQSQIASLRWMPLESVYCTTAGEAEETDLIKSLTRQQMLQVLANSPGSRTVLYTRGLCVYSYEQLLSVKMMAQSTRNL